MHSGSRPYISGVAIFTYSRLSCLIAIMKEIHCVTLTSNWMLHIIPLKREIEQTHTLLWLSIGLQSHEECIGFQAARFFSVVLLGQVFQMNARSCLHHGNDEC